MKYSDVINLMNNGIQSISSRTLDIGDAYIVVKFKSAIKKAFEQYREKEEAMFKEAGIDDPQSFFQKHRELKSKVNKDTIDLGLIKENEGKIERFNSLQAIAEKEEVNLELASRLSFDSWRLLVDVNKDIKTNYGAELLSVFEADLEGVLWQIEDQKEKKAKA